MKRSISAESKYRFTSLIESLIVPYNPVNASQKVHIRHLSRPIILATDNVIKNSWVLLPSSIGRNYLSFLKFQSGYLGTVDFQWIYRKFFTPLVALFCKFFSNEKSNRKKILF
jgi:hypothetical protein